MVTFDEIPRELQYKIIRMLPIDARRSLNIYTRLQVPEQLVDRLNNVIENKPHQLGSYTVLELKFSQKNVYKIARCYDEFTNKFIDCRAIHDRNNDIHYYMVWCILDF